VRTTVTLDPDVERLLKDEAHRSRQSFKQVLNRTVRQTLRPLPFSRPVLLPPRPLGFCPGIDPRHLGRTLDEMDAENHLALSRHYQGSR
jgi:hypothetical protein